MLKTLKLESQIVESEIESKVVEKKRRHYLFVVGWGHQIPHIKITLFFNSAFT